MLKIIQKRNFYFAVSGVLCLVSILSLVFWGLKPAIDFTGGSLMEITFQNSSLPQMSEVREKLSSMDLGDISVRQTGDSGIILEFKTVDEETHQRILKIMEDNFVSGEGGSIEEARFESIGSVIGKELKDKAAWSIVLVVVAIIFYIAWAFRKVSKPVASWKYGIGAVVALCHDILITAGSFSILGYFYGMEVDVLFITALLTILGYSVNDTIVVFDRTRENLHRYSGDFEDIVNRSVNETIWRSINSSLTVLLVLAAVYFLGGETIKNFALALIVGIVAGTYSSIFIASPLLVVWHKIGRKK